MTCWLIAAYLIYLRTGRSFGGLIMGLHSGCSAIRYVPASEARHTIPQIRGGLPQALEMMVSELAGGYSLVSAIGLVAAKRQIRSAANSASAMTSKTMVWSCGQPWKI